MVHWLDALTPPLEVHLRRLVESVRTLLQIDRRPPRIVLPSSATATSAASWFLPRRLILVTISLALVALTAAGLGVIWWLEPVAKANVDPALVGTFEQHSVVDDYDQRFISSIAANGT